MKSLLIIAHGSRRQTSNDEVRALTQRIATETGDGFDIVDCAFLELAEPSIPDGIQQCIQQGANEVIVLPYFLSAGRHVVEDIPNEVAQAQQQNPDVCIHIAPYLGSIDAMARIMATIAYAEVTPDKQQITEFRHAGNNNRSNKR